MDPLEALAGDLRERLLAGAGDGEADLPGRIRSLVDREAGVLSEDRRVELAARIAQRAFGLGPLEPLLADPAVDEIMVSGVAPVWVERRGRLECTGVRFERESDLRDAIERILAPLGRRADESEPLCDARLPDGSRVNVVLPPLALDGPALTIRRFRRHGLSPDDLVENGTLGRGLLDFLARAVRARASVLVCGGTGSGKTTTLNVLSSFVGAGERVVTIEDAAELRLRQPHVVRLEARPPNLEGRGEVTIRRLVRNALRMRPDRIIVGEVRGAEALDLLTALSTGHDGSLSTVHAGSPVEALRRIEVLALMSDVGLPHAAIREQIADAFDLVVCQARMADGVRRIVSVAEVVRVAAGPAARELYTWRDGTPRWRAALTNELAARLAAADEPRGVGGRGDGGGARGVAGRSDGGADEAKDARGVDGRDERPSVRFLPSEAQNASLGGVDGREEGGGEPGDDSRGVGRRGDGGVDGRGDGGRAAADDDPRGVGRRGDGGVAGRGDGGGAAGDEPRVVVPGDPLGSG